VADGAFCHLLVMAAAAAAAAAAVDIYIGFGTSCQQSSSTAQSSRISSDAAPPWLMWLLESRKNALIFSKNLSLPMLWLCWESLSQWRAWQQICNETRFKGLQITYPQNTL
jgi:hypothetical protein